jgi:hypothetical protein
MVHARRTRVLAAVPHYFGHYDPAEANHSVHMANLQVPAVRRSIVERTIAGLRALVDREWVESIDVVVCGISGRALVPVDHDCSAITDPRLLVYDAIDYLAARVDQYDYFILIEDDVLVGKDLVRNAVVFDEQSAINEVLHPNRIEEKLGERFVTDLRIRGGWTIQRKFFEGYTLGVAANPHSAIAVLSRAKFAYCLQQSDRAFRGLFRHGSFDGGYMASAFANLLTPVSLYRPMDELAYHGVLHQDPFIGEAPPVSHKWKATIKRFLPPIVVDVREACKRPKPR